MWEKNIDILAEQFKVYALDLWGFGFSTREPLDYGYPLYSEQVLLFMDNLGIQRASLVGQSMGGGTAVWFCLQNRQRVNKLLLVDCAGVPNALPLTGKFFNLPGVGEFFLGLNTNFIRRKNLADIFIHNKDLLTDSYFENVTRFHKIKGTTECFLTILRKQFFDTLSDQLQQLSQLDVPILIVWGRQDKAISLQKGQKLHKILKGSRFEILDKAGHVPNYDRAEEFNKLALNFLKQDDS
jgi:pimeloyl-ACP methyl ester carboxylesterase